MNIEHYYKFQTGLRKIFTVYKYRDIDLYMAYFDSFEIISTIKKVNQALSLGHNLLNIVFLVKKKVKAIF